MVILSTCLLLGGQPVLIVNFDHFLLMIMLSVDASLRLLQFWRFRDEVL